MLSKADKVASQLNLAHGTEMKNKEKQIRSSSEETVWAIVREGSPGGRSETTVVGFVKQVFFKVWSERERELWMSRVVSQKRKK